LQECPMQADGTGQRNNEQHLGQTLQHSESLALAKPKSSALDRNVLKACLRDAPGQQRRQKRVLASELNLAGSLRGRDSNLDPLIAFVITVAKVVEPFSVPFRYEPVLDVLRPPLGVRAAK
jgi:hypothetical protein